MSLRSALKSRVAGWLRSHGLERKLAMRRGTSRRLVLCYHRVVPDAAEPEERWTAPAMSVCATTLERQLDWVGRRYRFVPLEELRADEEAGDPSGAPLAAVTFDDGYDDVAENAVPLLRRKGIPASIFVVTGLVGTDALQVHDELHVLLARLLATGGRRRLFEAARRAAVRPGHLWRVLRVPSATGLTERLLQTSERREVEALLDVLRTETAVPAELRRRLRPMSWETVGRLDREGFRIGSHTVSHRLLPNERPEVVRAELEGSRRQLEDRLGREVRSLSYPCGAFDPTVVDAARDAGYHLATTTCSHRIGGLESLTIPRRTFWERTGRGADGRLSDDLLSCLIAGAFDPLRPCVPGHHFPLPRPEVAAAAAPVRPDLGTGLAAGSVRRGLP